MFEIISGLIFFASFVAPLYLGISLGMPLRFGFSFMALVLLCVYGAFSLFVGFASYEMTLAHHGGPLPSLIAFGAGLVIGLIWSYVLYDILYDGSTMRIKWSNLLPRCRRRRRR